MVRCILKAKKISTNLSKYDISKYGHMAQEWIDTVYGKGTYKIMVYDNLKKKTAIWTSNHDPKSLVLPIYKHGASFYPIKLRKQDRFFDNL